MMLQIPDKIYETFLNFLDLAQASFSEEQIARMSELEKQTLIWVENLLGNSRSMRLTRVREDSTEIVRSLQRDEKKKKDK